jgi:hypothetical protein
MPESVTLKILFRCMASCIVADSVSSPTIRAVYRSVRHPGRSPVPDPPNPAPRPRRRPRASCPLPAGTAAALGPAVPSQRHSTTGPAGRRRRRAPRARPGRQRGLGGFMPSLAGPAGVVPAGDADACRRSPVPARPALRLPSSLRLRRRPAPAAVPPAGARPSCRPRCRRAGWPRRPGRIGPASCRPSGPAPPP